MSTSFVKYAAPLLDVGVTIQGAKWESPAKLQEHIYELKNRFVSASTAMGKSNGEISDAVYALFSFLDELILKNSSFGYGWLEYRLMMKEFNDQVAGETFFTKTDYFFNDDTKKDLLELYGVCMLLGFQGKYQLEGLEGLQLKLKQLSDKVFPDTRDALPDFSLCAEVGTGSMPKERSGKSFILYSIAFVIVSCIVYMALVAIAQM